MIHVARTPPEILPEGFRALVDRLGLADALRFMQQYDAGQGDYTADRGAWLDRLSHDDVWAAIAKVHERRRQPG